MTLWLVVFSFGWIVMGFGVLRKSERITWAGWAIVLAGALVEWLV